MNADGVWKLDTSFTEMNINKAIGEAVWRFGSAMLLFHMYLTYWEGKLDLRRSGSNLPAPASKRCATKNHFSLFTLCSFPRARLQFMTMTFGYTPQGSSGMSYCFCFHIISINAPLWFDWPLYASGASPRIWTCDTRPFLLAWAGWSLGTRLTFVLLNICWGWGSHAISDACTYIAHMSPSLTNQ